MQRHKAYLDGTTTHGEIVGALTAGRLEPIIFESVAPNACPKPEGMRGFIDSHNYEKYVIANPELGLVGVKEVKQMLKILED